MDAKKLAEAKKHIQMAMAAIEACEGEGHEDEEDDGGSAPESMPSDDTSANSLKMKLGKYK